MAVVYLGVRHAGIRIGFKRPRITPNVKRLLVLAVPAAITGGITQINIFVGTVIASGADEVMSIIYNADRLYQLRGFDISNISDNHIVASMVRFKNGLPETAQYRRYRIKSVKGQNDFASMAEVVRRRYSRILLEASSSEPSDLEFSQESPLEAMRRLDTTLPPRLTIAAKRCAYTSPPASRTASPSSPWGLAARPIGNRYSRSVMRGPSPMPGATSILHAQQVELARGIDRLDLARIVVVPERPAVAARCAL